MQRRPSLRHNSKYIYVLLVENQRAHLLPILDHLLVMDGEDLSWLMIIVNLFLLLPKFVEFYHFNVVSKLNGSTMTKVREDTSELVDEELSFWQTLVGDLPT